MWMCTCSTGDKGGSSGGMIREWAQIQHGSENWLKAKDYITWNCEWSKTHYGVMCDLCKPVRQVIVWHRCDNYNTTPVPVNTIPVILWVYPYPCLTLSMCMCHPHITLLTLVLRWQQVFGKCCGSDQCLHQQKSTFLIPSYSILLHLIPLILGVRRE